MSGVSLSDGSGLTRANTLTPRALGTLLVNVQKERWFPAFKIGAAGGRQHLLEWSAARSGTG